VKVTSPAVDFAEFLKQYEVDQAKFKRLKRQMKELGLTSEHELKLYLLSQDKDAVARCTATRVRSVKMDYKRGALVSSVKLTRPGIHRFDLQVTASDTKGHPIVRRRTLNAFARPRGSRG
jgi:hypothetical protein